MKTYTFNINKKTANTVNNFVGNNSSNNSAYIDAVIINNLKKTAPYAFNTIDEDYTPTINFTTKKSTPKTINITIKKNKPHTSLDFRKYIDFLEAVNYLSSNNYDDSADFYLSDGTPVRIFEDEIQIGYELYSLVNFTENKYKKMSDKSKKAIIDLYISIKK